MTDMPVEGNRRHELHIAKFGARINIMVRRAVML